MSNNTTIAIISAISFFGLVACTSTQKQKHVKIIPAIGYTFHDILHDGSKGPELVWIPAGTFTMGDIKGNGEADEQVVHEVSIPRPFAIGKYEVTISEFQLFVESTDHVTDAEKNDLCFVKGGYWNHPRVNLGANHPVVCVSWTDATAYADWLSEQTNKKYRLPTEAEWEYVARAGTSTDFWWGDSYEYNHGNCDKCPNKHDYPYTAPVGSYKANPFGVHDTAGNVWEWTASEYTKDYSGKELSVATEHADTIYRSMRSGAWFNGPADLRSSNRGNTNYDYNYTTLGFRILREL